MDALSMLLSLCFVGLGLAVPASNEQLDKATINDYVVNTVSEDQKVSTVDQLQHHQQAVPSTVEISGIGAVVQKEPELSQKQQEPPKAGTAFARFIDDIFQIPISVLQNVAKLITNPFTQAKKDAAISAQVS